MQQGVHGTTSYFPVRGDLPDFSGRVHSVNVGGHAENGGDPHPEQGPRATREIAVETSAMLPVPTVADSAVDSAWKWDTSPASVGQLSFQEIRLAARLNLHSCICPIRFVRYRPVPSRTSSEPELPHSRPES